MFSSLTKMVSEAVSSVKSTIDQLANEKELSAVLAAAALIAYADGSVSPEEKAKVLLTVQSHPALSSYKKDVIEKQFLEYVSLLEMDFEMASKKLFEKIQPVAKDELSFIRVLGIAKQVATADGTLAQTEERMLKKIRDLK